MSNLDEKTLISKPKPNAKPQVQRILSSGYERPEGIVPPSLSTQPTPLTQPKAPEVKKECKLNIHANSFLPKKLENVQSILLHSSNIILDTNKEHAPIPIQTPDPFQARPYQPQPSMNTFQQPNHNQYTQTMYQHKMKNVDPYYQNTYQNQYGVPMKNQQLIPLSTQGYTPPNVSLTKNQPNGNIKEYTPALTNPNYNNGNVSLSQTPLNANAKEYTPSKKLNKDAKPYVPKGAKDDDAVKKKEEEEKQAAELMKQKEAEIQRKKDAEIAAQKKREEDEIKRKQEETTAAILKKKAEDEAKQAAELQKKKDAEIAEQKKKELDDAMRRKEEEEAAAVHKKSQPAPLADTKKPNETETADIKTKNIEKGTSKLSELFNSDKKTTGPTKKIIPKIETFNTVSKKQEDSAIKKKEDYRKQLEKQNKQEQQKKFEEEQKKKQEEEERKQKLLQKQQQDEERQRLAVEKLGKGIKPEEEKEKEKSKSHIERHYFIVSDSKKLSSDSIKKIYDLEYMNSFKNWTICKETKLLSQIVLQHLDDFRDYEDELPGSKTSKDYQRGGNSSKYNNKKEYDRIDSKIDRTKKPDFFTRGTDIQPPAEINMNQWGRKDISKELSQAETFKKHMDEIKLRDPVKFDLTEMLNILTVDNYEETKSNIYQKIVPSVEYQEKFLDVLFKKAVNEKAFVQLYARLCKEFDKELPQKTEKTLNNNKNIKPTSAMRSKLLDKCREIFKIENNSKFDSYIKVTDPDERELKMKKFVLGNVNFIAELINIQMLSKKIVFQCIDNLFNRYEKENGDEKLRLINLEAIVILIDKFGTLISKAEKKIKSDDMIDFQKRIDICMDKLDDMQQNVNLPGHIKYKIINLIEKKKAGWEESQYEKTTVAKGKEEVRRQYEDSQKKGLGTGKDKQLDQDAVNAKIRDDLYSWQEYIDDGKNISNYRWEIVTTLYSHHQNTIAEILLAFVENSIDFVQRETTLEQANLYFKELIAFYADEMTNEAKLEVIETVLKLLAQISNLTIDNNLIVDVWVSILYELNHSQIMTYPSLGRLHDIYEDDLKCLMTILKKLFALENEDKSVMNTFTKFGFVQENKELFDETMF